MHRVFFDAAGIESPGLSSAPAIGQWLAEKVAEKLNAKQKEDWNGTRKGIVRPELLSKEERAELIRKKSGIRHQSSAAARASVRVKS